MLTADNAISDVSHQSPCSADPCAADPCAADLCQSAFERLQASIQETGQLAGQEPSNPATKMQLLDQIQDQLLEQLDELNRCLQVEILRLGSNRDTATSADSSSSDPSLADSSLAQLEPNEAEALGC